MKKYTIFYSWQSDTPQSDLIIKSSFERFVANYELREGIHFDIVYSTHGVSTDNTIDNRLFEQIENCDLFLADLTPSTNYQKVEANGQTVQKEAPNPNVLIELGYAYGTMGPGYVAMVALQDTWSMANMPFDINHRDIYQFAQDGFDLNAALNNAVSYLKEHGRHRKRTVPFWYYFVKNTSEKIKDRWFTKHYNMYEHVATEESVVFFKKRISDAFPGVRGFKVINNPFRIYQALSKLFKDPLRFKKKIRGVVDPIWEYRGGEAAEIDSFKCIGWRKYRIGWHEMKIRRIAVYNDTGRYYGAYVYIEAEAQKPTGLYGKCSKEEILQLKSQMRGYVNEEYCIYKPFWFFKKLVTKQEEDDGSTTICGIPVKMKREDLEFRFRYLTDVNFIVAAKGSPFNSRAFERTSRDVLNGILDDKVSMEQLNEYMLQFPKKHDWIED